MAQLAVGMTGTASSSCAIMLLIAVAMPRILMSNNHVTSKVLMLQVGMRTRVCMILSLGVEVLGVCAGCSLCRRVAEGPWRGVGVCAGGLRERFPWFVFGECVVVGVWGVTCWRLVSV